MFSDLIKSTKTPTKTKTDADKKAADARVEELLAQLFKKGEGAEMESEGEGESAEMESEGEGAEMDKGGAMAWRRKLTERAKSLVSPTEEEANGAAVKACGDGYKGGEMKKAEEEEGSMSEDTDREEEPRKEEPRKEEPRKEEGAEEEGAEDMSREAMLERVEAMLEGLSDEELSDFLSSREVKKALAQSVFSAMTAAQLAEIMSPEQANGAELAEPVESVEG
jgi:hypothetical protein